MLAYRMILSALTPVLAGLVLVQRLRGRVGRAALSERLGRAAQPAAGQNVVWLHGASNGELTSARWLIADLLRARPDLHIVITCNSWTARAMVRDWGLPRVTAQLAPFDTPGATRRMIARSGAKALIFIENELWPERIIRMAAQGAVIGIGARLSQGSARNWQRFAPGLIAAMLRRITLLSAQDAGSEARFLALGLPADRIGPRLMLKAQGTQAASPTTPPFAPMHPRARILLAASTHTGEEAVILQGFAQARGQFDLLILAPRHPRRSAEVAAAIRAHGLSFATRSMGEVPGPGTAVYLADSLGEMPIWYEMAGATVIGGTFGDAGGHTPYEPARHGSAILHGPGVANFAEVFAELDQAQAALAVGRDGLGHALATLTAQSQIALAEAATATLSKAEGGAALRAAILAALPQVPDQARG
ncbi:3-deoxy-D-manno-octulosonic acid transferase [Gemmobacter serpentinus]|uniref:3-deoxy-D-manno-octulosonic acid transferase n=1 Tax=Gemmobacter serpentinus TaxID=2652247 RepID=UPI001CF62F4C|nr:glycosyltransferase N-terminal domain-containing protein [Gemmobacter serpentinus]